MPEDDCQATDRGHEIELESGADDAIHSADATELLRMYVDIPGNTLSKRVRRKCVDFNVRTLLVSKHGCRQPSKPGPSSCTLACWASYWYVTLQSHCDTNKNITSAHCTFFLGVGVMLGHAIKTGGECHLRRLSQHD